MKSTLLLTCALLFVPGVANGQEVAYPGLVVSFEDVIVVIGQRPESLPLPYEEVVGQGEATFTAERDFSGRTRFVYTRSLFNLGSGVGIEFHKEWHDGRGRGDTMPENEPPDFRGVIRW